MEDLVHLAWHHIVNHIPYFWLKSSGLHAPDIELEFPTPGFLTFCNSKIIYKKIFRNAKIPTKKKKRYVWRFGGYGLRVQDNVS